MDELLPETKVPARMSKSSQTEFPGLEEVRAICSLLEDHKGGDVIALDLRELHSWTDFFIIVTITSSTHLQGMLRHIGDYAGEQGLTLLRGHKKNDDSGGWNLVDMGTAVIHIMTAQSREFYELEELWSSAEIIYPLSYSSKSS